MARNARMLPVLVCLFALVSATLAQQPGTAVFHGRAVNSVNGLPVDSARVVLDDGTAGAIPEFETTTDTFGFFTIEDIHPTTYRLSIEHRGYLTLQTNFTFRAN